MAAKRQQLALCLRNKGYEVSLERRKIYPVLPDRDAAAHGQLRIIDESWEDYLYPATFLSSSRSRAPYAAQFSPPLNKHLKLAAHVD